MLRKRAPAAFAADSGNVIRAFELRQLTTSPMLRAIYAADGGKRSAPMCVSVCGG
jgi:hypothetical protein